MNAGSTSLTLAALVAVQLSSGQFARAAPREEVADQGHRWLDRILPSLKAFDIKSEVELRAALAAQGPRLKLHYSELLEAVDDHVSIERIWRDELRRDPGNLQAVFGRAKALLCLGRDADVIALINSFESRAAALSVDGDRRMWAEEVLPLRCEATWRLGEDGDALMARCAVAAKSAPHSIGPRNLARAYLKGGKLTEALRYAEVALRRDSSIGSNWFVHGQIASASGDQAAAADSWRSALEQWPDFTPAHLALTGRAGSYSERRDAELKWERSRAAYKLAGCVRTYAALKMKSRSDECAKAAATLDAAVEVAARLAATAEWDLAIALKDGLRLARSKPSPPVVAQVAELLSRAGRDDEAVSLLAAGETLDPVHFDINRLLAALCAGRSEPVCKTSRAERIRVGMPRDEHQSTLAYQPDSRYLGYVPPRFSSFAILPLGDHEFPELTGILEMLEKRFPGFRFRLLPRRPLPDGVINDDDQVYFEHLLPKLPNELGLLAIVERDFTAGTGNFLYSTWDPATGRGVISVNRLRGGGSRNSPAPPPPEQLPAASERLLTQLTGTTAKMLGVSFPCQSPKCALRFSRSIRELDAKGSHLCAGHQRELQRFLH